MAATGAFGVKLNPYLYDWPLGGLKSLAVALPIALVGQQIDCMRHAWMSPALDVIPKWLSRYGVNFGGVAVTRHCEFSCVLPVQRCAGGVDGKKRTFSIGAR